jgi:flagellar L-ring protein FlgH
MKKLLFISTVFFLLFTFRFSVFSQSLWEDKDPYSTGQNLKVGSIIKVELTEDFHTTYFYESNKDDTHTIKSAPDKKLIPEMMSFHSDRSIAQKSNGLLKAKNKVVGYMSVQVTDKEEESGNFLINGTRIAILDEQLYEVKLSGLVSPMDLQGDKTLSSSSIANLKLEVKSRPNQKTLNDPNLQLKPYKERNNRDINKAEISDEEKQKILLKNLKRMLGESE